MSKKLKLEFIYLIVGKETSTGLQFNCVGYASEEEAYKDLKDRPLSENCCYSVESLAFYGSLEEGGK